MGRYIASRRLAGYYLGYPENRDSIKIGRWFLIGMVVER